MLSKTFSRKHRTITSVTLTLFFLCVLLLQVSCQGKDKGSLKGTCVGRRGAGEPDIQVTLSGKNLKKSKTIFTDENGKYKIKNIPAGNDYVITYTKEGFSKITKSGIIIEAGKETVADISLGRWAKARDRNTELTEEQKRKIKELEAIGYLDGYRDATGRSGVTMYDKELAYEGLNLYISGHRGAAYLMDMEGSVLHEWSYDAHIKWPEGGRTFYWRRVFLYPNGDLLAIYEGTGLIKIDKDSNLIWAKPNGAHHDLHVAPDGTIFVLTREAKLNKEIHHKEPILEDYISILNPQGETIRKISLYQAYKNSSYKDFLRRMPPFGDIFHTNTIEILDGRHSDKFPPFKKGNALISSREMSTIAIVDLDKEKVVWAMGGNWSMQHDPTLLKNGNIMLFDNIHKEGVSRILEFNPVTKKKNWAYRAKPLTSFYSSSCGTNQRFPNGNTLITESDNGRAFEITQEKQIVWEFYNPHRAGTDNELVATLFEVKRINPGYIKEMELQNGSGVTK